MISIRENKTFFGDKTQRYLLLHSNAITFSNIQIATKKKLELKMKK